MNSVALANIWNYHGVMNYEDIFVVEDFDEAEQFRYEHNDQPVEVGTAVGYENQSGALVCFDGIYYVDHEPAVWAGMGRLLC